MATPEERKAKLQAAWHNQRAKALSNWGNPNSEFAKSQAADQAQARAREEQKQAEIEASVRAKAPELYAPKRQYADPGSFAGKMLPGGAPQPLEQLDLSGMKQKKGDFESHYAQQKAALALNRFAQNPVNLPPPTNSPTTQQSTGQDRVEQLKQSVQRTRALEATKNAALQRQEEQAGAQEEQGDAAQTLRKKAKAAARKGVLYLLNLIGGAIETVSGGVALLITGFIHFFTLGWLNTEMIYGSYFMKGKSKIIAPLSWEPIPMPIDKKGHILIAFVVAADIALVVAMVVLGSFGACFIHDVVKFVNSPMQAGAALAQGGTDLCLGAIISSTIGL